MTAKRFTIADGFKIVAIRDNGKIMNSIQVCNKLNELAEENKELKLELDSLQNKKNLSSIRTHKRITGLMEENKELKEKNKFILGQIKAFRDDCYTSLDFDGASTLNRLLDILREER